MTRTKTVGIVVGLIGLVACVWFLSATIAWRHGETQTDEVAVRVAALMYAFEQDAEFVRDRSGWLFLVTSDVKNEEVVQALRDRFPVVNQPPEIEVRDLEMIERRTGKRYAEWTIRGMVQTSGDPTFDVWCVKGGLNGGGMAYTMKKRNGVWYVESRVPTWVS